MNNSVSEEKDAKHLVYIVDTSDMVSDNMAYILPYHVNQSIIITCQIMKNSIHKAMDIMALVSERRKPLIPIDGAEKSS